MHMILENISLLFYTLMVGTFVYMNRERISEIIETFQSRGKEDEPENKNSSEEECPIQILEPGSISTGSDSRSGRVSFTGRSMSEKESLRDDEDSQWDSETLNDISDTAIDRFISRQLSNVLSFKSDSSSYLGAEDSSTDPDNTEGDPTGDKDSTSCHGDSKEGGMCNFTGEKLGKSFPSSDKATGSIDNPISHTTGLESNELSNELKNKGDENPLYFLVAIPHTYRVDQETGNVTRGKEMRGGLYKLHNGVYSYVKYDGSTDNINSAIMNDMGISKPDKSDQNDPIVKVSTYLITDPISSELVCLSKLQDMTDMGAVIEFAQGIRSSEEEPVGSPPVPEEECLKDADSSNDEKLAPEPSTTKETAPDSSNVKNMVAALEKLNKKAENEKKDIQKHLKRIKTKRQGNKLI